MQILLIGPEARAHDLKVRFSEHQLSHLPAGSVPTAADLQGVEVVFDLEFDARPEVLGLYATQPNCFFVVHANAVQLQQVAAQLGIQLPLFNLAGINAWPGCLAMEPWEMSVATETALSGLTDLAGRLNFTFERVADRVGMVTPRVICMIINEAFYTLQEGTAGKEDIDLGMKLGTNYPKGPFAWASEIGLKEVRRLLEAMYADTSDPRYKLCPLLKTESLGV